MKVNTLACAVVALCLLNLSVFNYAVASSSDGNVNYPRAYSKGKKVSSVTTKKNYSKHSYTSNRKNNRYISTISSDETIIFGKKVYIRSKENHVAEVSAFSALEPGSGYTLKIINNGKKRSRVTSAVVLLNGVSVFTQDDFNKKTKYLEAAVVLSGENQISVELQGKPGSSFTLLITGQSNGSGEDENLPPSITSTAITSVSEDSSYQYNVNAVDPNSGDSITYQLASMPVGMIIDTGTGLIKWTPTNSDVGIHPIIVQAVDSTGLSMIQNFDLTVINTNDAPSATNDSYSVNEDENLVINAAQGVLVNDLDEDGDILVAHIISSPTQGVVLLNANGSFSYSPNANYYGNDSFTYVALDDSAQSNLARVTISVSSVNDVPVANNDSFSVDEDQILIISPENEILANDIDDDGDTLVPVFVSGPSHGSVMLNTDGSQSYKPDSNFYGEDSINYHVSDGTATSNLATVRITVNPIPDPLPIVQFTAEPIQIKRGELSMLSWSVDTASSVSISPGIGETTLSGALSVQPSGTTTYTITAVGIDGVSTDQVAITVLAPPPAINFTTSLEQIAVGEAVTLSWDVDDANEITITPDIGAVAATGSVSVLPEQTTSYLLTASGEGGAVSQQVTIQVQDGSPLPPDPASVAPALKSTETTPFNESIVFLYSGANPVQIGIEPTTIEAERVAIIRGSVFDRTRKPLSGIKITIQNHPEFGSTLSRNDGQFDMAVNGGGLITINFEADGFLPVQRKLEASWNDFHVADDVVMTPMDSRVTTINLSNSTGIQVGRGTVQTDADGIRQATILFPQGTTATMTLPDGTIKSLSTINFRATEYTVGDTGFDSMPGPLPSTSAYTYAVELSLDEAIASNAKQVNFNQPLPLYVDNFLDFPVGEAVPTGFYDREKSSWIASENGRIISIVSIVNGMAELDIDGSGTAASEIQLGELGITLEERLQLGTLYQVGKSIWRSPINHFSSWDCNWPYGPPLDTKDPNLETASEDEDRPDDSEEEEECPGCIISPQGQTVGESIEITGTSLSLNYQSDRMPGYKANSAIDIQLSESVVPASLESISMTIDILGRRIEQIFDPVPNQSYSFVWDGYDAYGRKFVGSTKAKITVAHIYPCVYRSGDNGFGQFGSSIEPIGTRSNCQSMTFPKQFEAELSSPNNPIASIAGNWGVSVYHALDTQNNWLHKGDGGFSKITSSSIETVAGMMSVGGYIHSSWGDTKAASTPLNYPRTVVMDSEGNFYIADAANHIVRRVDTNGIITTYAGNLIQNWSGEAPGDGGLATQASINYPSDLAFDQEGNLYVADSSGFRVRKISTEGIITTVAGNGAETFAGDGGLAVNASLSRPESIALDQSGRLYIADRNRIRMVDQNGIIQTIAGNGLWGFSGDDEPAIEASMQKISDIIVDAKYNIYFSDDINHRVRKITPDGIITTIAGNGQATFAGDGGPAADASLYAPVGLALDTTGNLYISDSGNHRVRRVSDYGVINTIAGKGVNDFSGDGGLAISAGLAWPHGISFDNNGDLFIADTYNQRIRQIKGKGLINFHPDGLSLSSKDSGKVFIFNLNGLHLKTLDSLSGIMLIQFLHDDQGRLISIIDQDGNTVSLERNIRGEVTDIIAPDGQRTDVTVDVNGYLASLTNPAGETYQMNYTSDGLVTMFQDRKGNQNLFEYDDLGRVLNDINAAGGGSTLNRVKLNSGYQITMTSGEGRKKTFSVEPQYDGDQLQVNTLEDGTVQQIVRKTSGETVTTQSTGTQIITKLGPDPRFGMQSPITTELSILLPSGLQSLTTKSKTAQLSDQNNPLSLLQQTTITTVNGKTTTHNYDAATNSITTTTPEGRTSSQMLDDKGRIISITTHGMETAYHSYDSRGRLQETIQGSGADERINTFSYDNLGNIASVTNPLGETTSFEYDAVGRVLKQEKPDSSNIGFGYDANGNTTLITPPGKQGHTFTFNRVNLATDYTAPDIGLISLSTINNYDLDKNLTQVDRPDNQSVIFNHDPVTGQLSSMVGSRGTTTYEYDQKTGQLVTITAPGGEQLDYQYDGDLPVSKTWAGTISGEVVFGYNNDFRLSSMTVEGEVVNFSYDNDGILKQAGELALSYSAENGLLEGTVIGSTDTSQSYSSFGELAAFDATYNTTSIFNTSYQRDKLGRIISKSETVGGISHNYGYIYDVVGRLVEVAQDGVVSDTFSYDANGNRLSHNATSATYDEQDRLVSYGGAIYSYTDNGELTSKNVGGVTTEYSYDTQGNLTQVTMPDGTAVDYVIDGRNRRIGKQVNGQLVQGFLYQDQLNPVAELNGTGNVVSRFIYAEKGHVPSYMVKDGVGYRIISDHLGSVRLVVDATTGDVKQQMDYDAFGQVIHDSNPGFQPFGYAGGIYDLHTGLTRFGVRDYDAETGRWTAKDPIGFNGGDSNLYLYVFSNPLSYIDPDGKRYYRTPGFNLNLHRALENLSDPRPYWMPPEEESVYDDCFCAPLPKIGEPRGNSCELRDPYYGGESKTDPSMCPCK